MKLFVIGVGPLPFYRSSQPANALSEGTWRIVHSLLSDNHHVRIVTMEFGQRNQPEFHYLNKPRQVHPNLEHQSFPEPLQKTRTRIARMVQQSLAAFQPDAIISSGSVIASWVTTQLKHRLPLWYDLKGAFIPELQLRMQSPDAIPTFETFAVYKQVLLRGDRFSVVSHRQGDMVMGELGMTGRLNQETLQDQLVHIIPSGIDPKSPGRKPSGRIRGCLAKENDLVLFSSGGFNTWQDTRCFFETIEQFLKQDPNSCFVCLGGGIGGHYRDGYEAFREWTQSSPVRARFHLMGWVPQEQVIEYESEADIGVNMDLDVPESHYGDRSRFLSWMARGVVVATTPVSEPSRMLVEKGMAIGLPVGDSNQAVQCLAKVASNREKLKQMAEKANEFVRSEWSFNKTTEPLRKWAQKPTLARDNQKWIVDGTMNIQQELGSLELVVDYLFSGEQRREGSPAWKKLERCLYGGWPWADGKRMKP